MALFEGFTSLDVSTQETRIHLVMAGQGPPVLLLHGYPQTHACWHRVAPRLARSCTVVCPDLRGYGDSGRPPSGKDHAAYSKRAMAAEQLQVMAALGFERFAVVGHDRGARVAYRLALDHPQRIVRLAVLDIIPTLEMWDRIDRRLAMTTFHWLFLAQPDGLPERLIGADPNYFLQHTLDHWSGDSHAIQAEARAEYERCFTDPEVIHATCEDYRAGATIDVDHDKTDHARRKIECPTLVLWAERDPAERLWDTLAVWRGWAHDVLGAPLRCGHFLPEEAPEETAAALLDFLAPWGVSREGYS